MPARRRAPRPPANRALERCVNIADLEALAKKRLPKPAYDYYAGGSEDERTLGRNRSGFDGFSLLPRVLADVSRVETETEVLGAPVSMPILIAPTAYQKMAAPDGEAATARAAAAAKTLMVASTLSTCTLEEIAEAGMGPLWFQLYVFRDREVTARLIARAEDAGYRALVLTVDTPLLGRRERDVRNGFRLSPGLAIANLAGEGARRARWDAQGSMAAYAAEQLDPSLTWESVAWFRNRTKLPIVLKGIMRADDARRAVEHGAAAVWVSNHGGRQLDGADATIRALPRVVGAVEGRAEVYVDGGFRRGTDVLKALALGARGVLLGRPILWGLAASGERGVRFALELLREELRLAMALAGCPDLRAVDPSLIVLDA